MMRTMKLLAIGLAAGITSPAFADGWEVQPQSDTTNLRLLYKGDSQATYRFDCAPTQIILTETGVTNLLDLRTNTKIGDTPGSTMTPGAALMALSTDVRGAPGLLPAETTTNAVRGWDMTIRLDKKDKALRALGKANMVSVFTTGYTMAVGLYDADKQAIKGFLTQCGVKL